MTAGAYVIESELYGDTSRFPTLEAAEAGIRACGFEVTLSVRWCDGRGQIINERGEVVGYVSDPEAS